MHIAKFICVLWAITVLVTGLLLWFKTDEVIDLQKEAVKRGHAIYNPTNGIWQWK